ncbi:hypothetical protein V6N12_037563 [Hibiscus sabdariffa]|uniref:Uncharacterized protein n=1 Tax=Hibiscus sabdariffa TaxID=183260 RepID=A0ABR2C173_9ROSI
MGLIIGGGELFVGVANEVELVDESNKSTADEGFDPVDPLVCPGFPSFPFLGSTVVAYTVYTNPNAITILKTKMLDTPTTDDNAKASTACVRDQDVSMHPGEATSSNKSESKAMQLG